MLSFDQETSNCGIQCKHLEKQNYVCMRPRIVWHNALSYILLPRHFNHYAQTDVTTLWLDCWISRAGYQLHYLLCDWPWLQSGKYAGVSLVAQDAILEWQWKITQRSGCRLCKGNNWRGDLFFKLSILLGVFFVFMLKLIDWSGVWCDVTMFSEQWRGTSLTAASALQQFLSRPIWKQLQPVPFTELDFGYSSVWKKSMWASEVLICCSVQKSATL